ncbi:transposase [Methylobacterium sp. IF7SW-B2]|nr:transposase [Methylobacterium ajmalii]MBK3411728.1 transposase [Methylobacterium ajmalii]MBK3423025.1 transposase [Methylobacterium ajmalii]
MYSTNPLERLNGETKRRIEVVGILPPHEPVIRRLIGTMLPEQNDERVVQRCDGACGHRRPTRPHHHRPFLKSG